MTQLTVKELPKLSPGMHADGHGLYMNVKSSGARSWIFRATINGKRREVGLGGFPVVNLADARDTAIDMQRQLRAGVDPLAERVGRQRTSTTFEEIAHALHREKSKTWRNGKHTDQCPPAKNQPELMPCRDRKNLAVCREKTGRDLTHETERPETQYRENTPRQAQHPVCPAVPPKGRHHP